MKNSPRIIFINAHENDFLVRNLARIQSGNNVKSFKHQFLVKHLIQQGYDVYNLMIRGNDVFSPYPLKTYIHRLPDVYYVEMVNRVRHLPTLRSLSEVKPNDILVGYLVYPYQLEVLKNCNCYKVLFGNHFISISSPISLKDIGVNAFVNEIDFSSNEFVKKYLDLQQTYSIIAPYIYADRFMDKKPFNKRLNKAMAIGTSSTTRCAASGYELFEEMYHTEWIQPMRQFIYEHKDELEPWIDSYISYILEDKPKAKQNVRFKWYNKFVPVNTQVSQTSYTKFDMVETFNNYKMFLCPEELVGMPGIGFAEGMACGCAYIGLNHTMYTCLGLVPDYHYITYDGTPEDMKRVIETYKNKPDELETIAKRGCAFVREHFNTKRVAEYFEQQLMQNYNEYLKTI